MKPMSANDLQAARKAAAERYYSAGMSYLPEGWTFEFRKSLTGICYPTKKHLSGPRPVTRKSLYIWLHECAHAHLHAESRKKRHVEEMEAEQWAHEKMREHEIPVPRSMTARAKAYVARKIEQAEIRGAKTIDPRARRFAKKSHTKHSIGFDLHHS